MAQPLTIGLPGDAPSLAEQVQATTQQSQDAIAKRRKDYLDGINANLGPPGRWANGGYGAAIGK